MCEIERRLGSEKVGTALAGWAAVYWVSGFVAHWILVILLLCSIFSVPSYNECKE